MASVDAVIVYSVIIFFLVLSIGLYMVRTFAQPSITPPIRALVLFAWTLAFFMISLLPVDLMDIERVEDMLVHMWTTLYWINFLFVWVIVPITQDYHNNGAFNVKERIRAALLPSVKLGIVAGCGAAIFVIVMVILGRMTFDALPGLVIAVSTTYGLVLLTLTLGYGLIEVPRQLWYTGDRPRRMRFLEHRLGALHDDALEEQDKLQQLFTFLHSLIDALPPDSPFRGYLDTAVAACPPPTAFDFALGPSGSARVHTVEEVHKLEKLKSKPPGELTERDLATLHHMAITHARNRYIMFHQWVDTVTEYFNVEALHAVQGRTNRWHCLAAPVGYPSAFRSVIAEPAAAVILATTYPAAIPGAAAGIDLSGTGGGDAWGLTTTSSAITGGYSVTTAAPPRRGRSGSVSLVTQPHSVTIGSDDIANSISLSSAADAAALAAAAAAVQPAAGGVTALLAPAGSRPTQADYRYHYAVHWSLLATRIKACLAGAMSAVLLWSEFMFVMPVDLSPIGAIVRSVNHSMFWTQFFTLIPLAYIVFCAYFTLFNVRMGLRYFMHNNRRTDVVSFLQNAVFALLLTPPMARNFFKLLRVDESALFTAVGKPADVIPVLTFVINYFPLLLVVLAAITFFNLFSKILKWLHIPHFDAAATGNDDQQATGRSHIARERRARFGARARPVELVFADATGVSVGGLTGGGGAAGTSDDPEAGGAGKPMNKWEMRRAELAAGIYVTRQNQTQNGPGAQGGAPAMGTLTLQNRGGPQQQRRPQFSGSGSNDVHGIEL